MKGIVNEGIGGDFGYSHGKHAVLGGLQESGWEPLK